MPELLYDLESLADRIEAALPPTQFIRRRMFGGYCFMLNGNMAVCASKSGLIVRIGADNKDAAMQHPHTSPFMGGSHRQMAGFITVEPPGFKSESDLKFWIDEAKKFVETLPAK